MLKFRVHPIVLTADIEKAYLQVNIDEEQRDSLRFLWHRNLQEESIIKYKFTRVIFSVTSFQFLLNGTVQTHANKYENIDPEFARKVKGAPSGLGQFLATESPLKIMKNAFYFTLKALFVLKIFKFLC